MVHGNHLVDGYRGAGNGASQRRELLTTYLVRCSFCGDHHEDGSVLRIKCTGDHICDHCLKNFSIKDLMVYTGKSQEVAIDIMNELFSPATVQQLIQKHDELKG
jgi:hypothetical protein